jgi:hypothetical protein
VCARRKPLAFRPGVADFTNAKSRNGALITDIEGLLRLLHISLGTHPNKNYQQRAAKQMPAQDW